MQHQLYWNKKGTTVFLLYQAILIESHYINILVTNIMNPASFLSGSISEQLVHDC